MTVYPVLRGVLRVAVMMFAVGALAGAPALLLTNPLHAAPSSPASDAGVIAYVKFPSGNIRLISPDGTNDRVLWPNPSADVAPIDLAWRPDGGELAFTSQHERTCSFYDSDVYAIRSDGTGYRRVTNAPACAGLAALPKGTVTVDVQAYMTGGLVYVAGAPGIQPAASGTMTFNDVADFGPGVLQPSVAIVVLDRTLGGPPFADVQPGQTVPGGNLIITQYSSFRGWGAGKVSWKAGGAAVGYNMRDCSNLNWLAAVPTYGLQGAALPVKADATPCSMAWKPTPAGSDEYLYYSYRDDELRIEPAGIFLSTVSDASGGTKLVAFDDWSFNRIVDIEWLPDGSGFLYNQDYMVPLSSDAPLATCGTEPVGPCTNIFKYNLAAGAITQLTDFPDQSAQYFSVSPDGQSAVFERTTDSVDPTSELWILDLNTGATQLLVQDAGRPAWGPSAAPAAAPTVSVGLNGTNVLLSWTDNPANVAGYRVWYSEKPYFQPGEVGATPVDLPAGSTGWTHTGAAGSTAHNYFYLVQGKGAGEVVSGPSNRTGGFNFQLMTK